MAASYKELNHLLADQLVATAKAVGVYEHPTAKGDGREEIIRQFLAQRVGSMFGVNKAEVIDSNGARSNEIDAVIFDQSVAASLHILGQRHIVRVETVVATVEVKSRLDSTGVEQSARAIHDGLLQLARFYQPAEPLHIFGSLLHDAEETREKLARGVPTVSDYKSLGRIVNAIFAYEGPSIEAATNYLQNSPIDIICVLNSYTIAKKHLPFKSMEHNQIVEWGCDADSLGAFLHVLENVLQCFRASRFWIRPDMNRYISHLPLRLSKRYLYYFNYFIRVN